MKLFSLLFFIFLSQFVLGQNTFLTAKQILDSSIAFCGSFIPEARSELTYVVLMPDKKKAIIDEKRIEGEKYAQSILSMSHVSQTTFFDGKSLTRINGDSILKVQNLKSIEEIKLKTYSNLQLGYKSLNYELAREDDIQFKNFDCYVLKATSKKGYSTLNYFDKTNFRLLMVIYPNGNKSLMIKYEFKNGTLINSHIVNTFANSTETQTIKLAKYKTDREFSDLWFKCPYTTEVKVPGYIKTGMFESSNGPETKFSRTLSSQNYFDYLGNTSLIRHLKWVNSDSMGLMSEEDIKNNITSPESTILVRIISWDSTGYVCQWLAGKYSDTQDYKLID